MRPERLDEIAARAVQMLAAAKRALDADKSEWAESDPEQVRLVAMLMMNTVGHEEAREAQLMTGTTMIGGPAHKFFTCGWHVPGHVDERGAPVVLLTPPGVVVWTPNNAIPLMLCIPAGREDEARKTYPEVK